MTAAYQPHYEGLDAEDNRRVSRISDAINRLCTDYERKLAVMERLQEQLASLKREEARLIEASEVEEKAQAVLLKLEDVWRKDFEKGIEAVITDGINLVFGTQYAFVLATKVERGASAIEFSIETPTAEVGVEEAVGGSMVQVISFLLRVILIKAARPPLRPVIILDEAFNAVSEEFQANVGLLLRKVVEESGVQIIMVAHERKFVEYADVAYEAQSHKGVCRFRLLEAA